MIRWFLPPIAVLLVLVPAAQAAAVSPLFGVPSTVATAASVGGMTEQEVGDVNADGIADLVVTRLAFPLAYATFPIGVFLGDGRGGFRDGSSLFAGPIPRTQHGRQIVIADFNGDRRNDIFVADHGYDAEPFPGHPNTLVLSTPEGKFMDASGNMPAESGFSHSAAAADVDRDGDVDIYVGNMCACAGDGAPEILLNDGAGHFSRAQGLLPAEIVNTASGSYTRAAFVDANTDGAPDLVLGAFSNTPDSAVLLNDGAGRFHFVSGAIPPKALGTRSILISLATLDVNRDAHPDLLAGFQREDFSGRRLQVLIGDGVGRFRDETAQRLPVQSEGSAWPYAIRVADVNGDGRSDFGVALAQGGEERPALYVDDGTGVFRMSVSGDAGQVFSFVDADRDRHPDILSSYSGGTEGVERHELQLQLAPPARPSRLVAASTQRGSIRLTWRAVAGADRYEVWRASKGSLRKRVVVTTNARFEDRRVQPRVLCRYWVTDVNAVGRSAFSVPASARRS